ncbi:MAG: hypothetical protein ACK56F_13820 [bacterium]
MKENTNYHIRVEFLVENDEVKELKYVNNIKRFLLSILNK